jgi:hypothetical protein
MARASRLHKSLSQLFVQITNNMDNQLHYILISRPETLYSRILFVYNSFSALSLFSELLKYNENIINIWQFYTRAKC